MRKALVGTILSALTLGGCASTSSVPTSNLTLADVVQDAVLASQALCAVAPTAATITSIILAANGNSAAQLSEQAATAAATAFCGAVAAKKSAVRAR